MTYKMTNRAGSKQPASTWPEVSREQIIERFAQAEVAMSNLAREGKPAPKDDPNSIYLLVVDGDGVRTPSARELAPIIAAGHERALELRLPQINGKAEVTFKDEGSVRGKRIGPVFITDLDRVSAWCKSRGQTPDNMSWHIGEMPDGITEIWVSHTEAQRIAKRYGVELSEA